MQCALWIQWSENKLRRNVNNSKIDKLTCTCPMLYWLLLHDLTQCPEGPDLPKVFSWRRRTESSRRKVALMVCASVQDWFRWSVARVRKTVQKQVWPRAHNTNISDCDHIAVASFKLIAQALRVTWLIIWLCPVTATWLLLFTSTYHSILTI